jgi:hypothetical protein
VVEGWTERSNVDKVYESVAWRMTKRSTIDANTLRDINRGSCNADQSRVALVALSPCTWLWTVAGAALNEIEGHEAEIRKVEVPGFRQ